MEDQNESKKNNQKPHDSTEITTVQEAKSNPGNNASSSKNEKWYKKRPDWAHVFQLLGIIIAGAVASIYWQQLQVMSGQLREMESGSWQSTHLVVTTAQQASATHELAVQAKNQADRTKDVADRALAQANATNRLAAETRRQSDIARDAMNSNIELSREGQRPWVGLQAVQCNGCTIAADRSLNIQDLAGLIANTGRTPALQMVIDNYVAINVPKGDPVPDWPSIERKRKEDEERPFQIPPNLPPWMAAEMAKSLEEVKKDMAFRKSVSVLPPNGTRILHFLPSIKIGREPFPNREQKVSYVVGQISYYDALRNRQYTTIFCMVNDFGTDFRFCPTGNDMN
jgi:hypothetical protein